MMERRQGEATSDSIYAKLRNPQLWRPAVADKLEDLSYVGYFDADEPFRGGPLPEWCFRVFETPNGFHAISCGRITAGNKRKWYEIWKEMYPQSDYQLNNLNWLSPHSAEEAEFITRVARGVPLMCVFYRDKAVFENMGIEIDPCKETTEECEDRDRELRRARRRERAAWGYSI